MDRRQEEITGHLHYRMGNSIGGFLLCIMEGEMVVLWNGKCYRRILASKTEIHCLKNMVIGRGHSAIVGAR